MKIKSRVLSIFLVLVFAVSCIVPLDGCAFVAKGKKGFFENDGYYSAFASEAVGTVAYLGNELPEYDDSVKAMKSELSLTLDSAAGLGVELPLPISASVSLSADQENSKLSANVLLSMLGETLEAGAFVNGDKILLALPGLISKFISVDGAMVGDISDELVGTSASDIQPFFYKMLENISADPEKLEELCDKYVAVMRNSIGDECFTDEKCTFDTVDGAKELDAVVMTIGRKDVQIIMNALLDTLAADTELQNYLAISSDPDMLQNYKDALAELKEEIADENSTPEDFKITWTRPISGRGFCGDVITLFADGETYAVIKCGFTKSASGLKGFFKLSDGENEFFSVILDGKDGAKKLEATVYDGDDENVVVAINSVTADNGGKKTVTAEYSILTGGVMMVPLKTIVTTNEIGKNKIDLTAKLDVTVPSTEIRIGATLGVKASACKPGDVTVPDAADTYNAADEAQMQVALEEIYTNIMTKCPKIMEFFSSFSGGY